MARKRTRTAADIVMDITVMEMESDRVNVFYVNAPDKEGSILLEGLEAQPWTVLVRSDLRHVVTGTIPDRIARFL